MFFVAMLAAGYNPRVRLVALWMLRLLEPAKLAQYAHAVVVRLKDNDRRARKQALMTLQKL